MAVYIGTGSNVGDSVRNLAFARLAADSLPVSRCLRCSRIYRSAPIGPQDQPDFLNQVIELETGLRPCDLLVLLQQIELDAGREPLTRRKRWGPRVLDMDILLFDGVVMNEEVLCIPHRELHHRVCMLAPLCDLCPDRIHPVEGKTMKQLLDLHLSSQQVEVWYE